MAQRNVRIYRREDYEAMRAVIPGSDLPHTYEEWAKATEQEIAKLETRGDTVVKVIFNPEEYARYCHASGLNHDFASLGAFTVFAARKQAENGA